MIEGIGVDGDRPRLEKKAMMTRAAAICRHQRLCWTSTDHIGPVPWAVEVGDKICMFYGGEVLYVLRESDNGVQCFVGECYIHGLMDGEGFAQFNSDAADDEEFVRT